MGRIRRVLSERACRSVGIVEGIGRWTAIGSIALEYLDMRINWFIDPVLSSDVRPARALR